MIQILLVKLLKHPHHYQLLQRFHCKLLRISKHDRMPYQTTPSHLMLKLCSWKISLCCLLDLSRPKTRLNSEPLFGG